MTDPIDPIEERLRSRFAHRAASVTATPDLAALVGRSTRPSRVRGLRTTGAVGLALLVGGAGLFAGIGLESGAPAASTGARTSPPRGAAAPSTARLGAAGADLAPGAGPSFVIQPTDTFLLSRTTVSGIAIRAYDTGATGVAGCASAGSCPPTGGGGSPPCPTGALCAQPAGAPVVSSGVASGAASASGGTASGGTASSGPATPSQTIPPASVPPTLPPNTVPPSTVPSSPAPPTPAPSPPASACNQVVLELSNARAVGDGQVLLPAGSPSAPQGLTVLGEGTFGVVEGSPVTWVAVWVGTGVDSVRLTSNGVVLDASAPTDNIVVLAAAGASATAGATVVGLNGAGTVVATVPAGPVSTPGPSGACISQPAPVPPASNGAAKL